MSNLMIGQNCYTTQDSILLLSFRIGKCRAWIYCIYL